MQLRREVKLGRHTAETSSAASGSDPLRTRCCHHYYGNPRDDAQRLG
jgi:hypothetical protein